MNFTFFQLLFYFLVYAFMGWCVEVFYAAVTGGKFVNRGFLNGPVCPIYGFGVVSIIVALTPLKDNFFLLFLGSVALTSLLELITGFILEKIFHKRWWDYSEAPFNVKGYICLKFSLLWGFAAVFAIDIIQPMISALQKLFESQLGYLIVGFLTLVLLVDFILTVIGVAKLSAKIRAAENIQQHIHRISDEIGEEIFEGAMKAQVLSEDLKKEIEPRIQKKTDELKSEFSEKKAGVEEKLHELEELCARKKELLSKKSVLASRIFKAFPDLNKKNMKK